MKSSKNKVPNLALGISLFLLGIIFLLGKPGQLLKSTTFETEPVNVVELSNLEYDSSKFPKRVIIPELSIDLEVKKSEIVNGYWRVYEDSAGWGVGSGIPGENGNQVIFAHAREGLFLPLQSIKVGNRMYVLTQERWYSYEVKDIKEVYPNQTEVIATTDDETLTLYTCSGFADTKRLIVIAKRV